MTELILKKRELLSLAEAEVKKLRNQIATLEEIASGDDFAQYLEEKKAKLAGGTAQVDTPPKPIVLDYFAKQKLALGATQLGRNPKGLIRREILAILADGIERDLDHIEDAIGLVTPNRVGRPALRAFLMNLRKDGAIASRRAGLFQIAQKGESPVTAGLSGATELGGS